MRNIIRTAVACCAIAACGLAFAQTGSTESSGGGAAAQTGKQDPYVQNREEKAQARKEYRKDKSGSKEQYREERKAANSKLRQSGAHSESTKNLDAPQPK
jgi:hypothetical protein